MAKKFAVVALIVAAVTTIGAYFWARTVLTGEAVRAALAAQISAALGQPVTIGRLNAAVFPRVAVSLGDVQIGNPARVRVTDLYVGTDLRALLWRRIEHASLRISGAHVDLPIALPGGGSDEEASTGAWPVEIVSVDDIALRDVEIASGGRTVRADVDLTPRNRGLLIRRASFAADGTKFTATGTITDVSAPAGNIDLEASSLNLEQLSSFASAFSAGAGLRKTGPSGSRSAMNVAVGLHADRATFRTLAMSSLAGVAHVRSNAVTLDPVTFNLFGGGLKGTVLLTPARDALGFRVSASVSGIDVAAASAFAGAGDTISGHLSGRLDISGRATGSTVPSSAMHGTARVDIADGVIKNLGLLRAVVIATSMRAGASQALTTTKTDEPFSRLAATLAVANGAITTNDLELDSENLTLNAHGALQLRTSTLDVQGKVRLSETLSQQAGRDLYRYTQEGGRVTLPVTVTGPTSAPRVTVDLPNALQRALGNVLTDKLRKLLKK